MPRDARDSRLKEPKSLNDFMVKSSPADYGLLHR